MNKEAILKMSGLLSAVNKMIPKNPNKIVFYSNMGFRDNAKAIYDYVVSRDCSRYQIICAVNDWKDFVARPHPDNVQFVSPGAGVKHFFTSKYFFFSFGKYPVKPSKKQVVINTTHGSPLKKIGNYLDDRDYNFFTYVLAASDFFAPIIQKSFGCREEQVKVCGHPRNDAMFVQNDALKQLGFEEEYDKVILWMPTFRQSDFLGQDDIEAADGTGLPILSDRKDMERVNERLKGKNCLMIAKIHPAQDLSLIDTQSFSNIKIVTNARMQATQCNLYELLSHADALITDYSSVYFDYLLLDRPIGFTVDDIGEYMKNRGFVVDDPYELMPGAFINTPEQFLGFVDDLLNGKDDYKEKRQKVNGLVNKFEGGRDCERVLEIAGIKL